MITTRFGRIGADPLLVPTAASMQSGRRETFAEHLDEANAGQPECAPAASPAETPAAPETVAQDHAPVAAPEAEETTDIARIPFASDRGDEPAPGALPQGGTEPVRQPEAPATQPQAGQGTGSSRAAASAAATTLPVQVAAATVGARASAAFAAAPAQGPMAAAGRSEAPGLRGVEGPAAAKAALQRAAAAQAGFRTMNPHAVQMLEQARDSVFKQILFKLGNEGSEMRMRLEPPELGELDLRMVVEKTGQVQLWIGADRPELVQMLERNLGALQQTLRENGLDVTHAEVFAQTGGSGGRMAGRDDAATGAARTDDDDGAITAPAARTGWITTQGLDFWV